jgi:hypothetical protein
MQWSSFQKNLSKFMQKKFNEIDTCGQYYTTFLGIIYATSSIFPYDFA